MNASYQKFFSGKKITLMGLGLLGRGVGDAEFLAQTGAELTVTDLKPEADLATSIERLKKFPNIEFVLGRHREEDFQNRDMIIKAAGVPLDSPYIKTAQDAGVPVYMSTALFAKFAVENMGARIIGITGTRGKSTVTQMIYDAIAATGVRVHLGGNIKGKSTLALLPEIKMGDIVVLELDSWQLQGFRDLNISPHIAVFTNFMPDHMNYYNNDMEAYFRDKAAIFEHQKPGDILITTKEMTARIKALSPTGRGVGEGDVAIAGMLPSDWKLSVPGAHNRENAALARAALHACGQADEHIRKSLEKFSALEGRLSLCATIDGVKIYNDTNSTTPAATVAALKSFEPGRVLLIAGGADKTLDLENLPETILACCRGVALLAGTGTKRLSERLPQYPVFDNLNDAFTHLMKEAQTGDSLILSPGFASFGMFKNEYDRGGQFENLVKKRAGRA